MDKPQKESQKGKKKPRYGPEVITKEQIEQALEYTKGNYRQAQKLFQFDDGSTLAWVSFWSACRHYGLDKMPERYRAIFAVEALETLQKAAKKEWKAALEMLNRFGKYLDIHQVPKKTEQQVTVNDVDKLMADVDPEYSRMVQNSERPGVARENYSRN